MKFETGSYKDIRRFGFSIHADKIGITIWFYKWYLDLRKK